MQVKYLDPYVYYYTSNIKPPQVTPVRVSDKSERKVEPIEKSRFLDKYA